MANDIKRTPDFTAFLANSTGQGRVSRHSIARGKLAIVPESFEFERDKGERSDEPVRRSFVSDAGLFDSFKR